MGSADCIFCRIVAGSIPCRRVEVAPVGGEAGSGDRAGDEEVFAFEDLKPQAPQHILIVPRKHLATVNDLDGENSAIVGKLFLAAKAIARARGIDRTGYRLVMNCNQDAGQTVFHIHLHLLGGRLLGWPPG